MATVLITAGPTREHLDDVRFLSNGSTGRMGYALAAAAARAGGDRVVLVSGPTALEAPEGVECVRVVSALEMAAAVRARVADAQLVFGVAAVADHRPAARTHGKPAKATGPWTLDLVPNPDVIAEVAAAPGLRAVVGFALESADEPGGVAAALDRAARKCARKGLDAIAVNLGDAVGAPASEIWVLRADGGREALPRRDKAANAERLLAIGWELWRDKQ